MLYIHPAIAESGKTQFIVTTMGRELDEMREEGLCVEFSSHRDLLPRYALKAVAANIEKSEIDWINATGPEWVVDFERAKSKLSSLKELEWLKGSIRVRPQVDTIDKKEFNKLKREAIVRLCFYKEEVEALQARKIFLSHKGSNKPLVKQFNTVLKMLGFDTWLDDEAMVAGDSLERGLLQGMKDSCAAIFFITPDFVDEKYLASEVEYAIREWREKGKRFQIITLVFADEEGKRGKVPELLEPYVWKKPASDLEALQEILRALPLTTGDVKWKE